MELSIWTSSIESIIIVKSITKELSSTDSTIINAIIKPITHSFIIDLLMQSTIYIIIKFIIYDTIQLTICIPFSINITNQLMVLLSMD